jgi:hypothetical protein
VQLCVDGARNLERVEVEHLIERHEAVAVIEKRAISLLSEARTTETVPFLSPKA